jgi:hypothetical protein
MSHKTAVIVAHTIGIDTGKNTLHLIGLDDKGAIVLREKIARGRIAARLANVPRCLIGLEAGMATHYVARELSALGHDIKQVPPVYAKPFRQGHKNDFRDAYAVAEAVQRPSTRCVPVKTDNQLDLQALHRVRSRLVSDRTAVINQIRSFLERGIPVRQGLRFLRHQLPDILATRTDVLSPRRTCPSRLTLIRCPYQKLPPNQPNCGWRTIANLGAGARFLASLLWCTGFGSRTFALDRCDWSADNFCIAKASRTLVLAGATPTISGAGTSALAVEVATIVGRLVS